MLYVRTYEAGEDGVCTDEDWQEVERCVDGLGAGVLSQLG